MIYTDDSLIIWEIGCIFYQEVNQYNLFLFVLFILNLIYITSSFYVIINDWVWPIYWWGRVFKQ